MTLTRAASLSFVPFLITVVAGCSGQGSSGQTVSAAPTTRTYYIAADEVLWNYAPDGMNKITGKPFEGIAKVYTQRSPHHVGSVYRKAVYREYTDGTFTKLKTRPADQQYLGLLGPVIHAQVGDTIKVVFKNNASRPYSMHPHGVQYDKMSEGVAYDDGSGTHDMMGDAVPPGQTFTYTWQVPERAGPGPGDPSSIVWLYHSHVDEQKDVDAGLVGPIIVTAAGMANADGAPKDVDREIVILMGFDDENQSWYMLRNVAQFAPEVKGSGLSQAMPVDANGLFTLTGSGFVDSNVKAVINGYMYGNGPRITMKKGERVRWYLMTIGMGFNFHTPHWHGNTVLWNRQRTDVVPLSPAQMATVDMVPDSAGTWLFHCHVSDHMDGGMVTLYEVEP
ncbi:MAG: multicopper oxidase domain-containing protein [Candidatus Eremiobacteraeota bacterium]|nr:multicopper oxidase domain-containing protein [Candidatus Eremiobacteraeota bacterium]